MITVVVDTSVIVSAAFRDRVPEEVVLFISDHEDFEWIVSTAILEEYNEVLARKKFSLSKEILQKWSDAFEYFTTLVEAETGIEFPRDQKDAKFLECALASDADYLITGDHDFKEARKLVNITIISVSQFRKLIMEKLI